MKMFAFAALALVLGLVRPGPSLAQVPRASTQGCASPIVVNSTINQLRLVCGQNDPNLAKIVAKLNDLAARRALTPTDLQSFATGLNTKIDKVSNDTDEIKLLLLEVLMRLDAAAANPGKAPKLLGPYMEAATDITNRRFEINEFLDINGRQEHKFTFRLEGACQVFITPPKGTGFTVAIAILSDAGTPIWRSLQGTQGSYRPVELSTGVYQFAMHAKRDAGQYSATISSRCA